MIVAGGLVIVAGGLVIVVGGLVIVVGGLVIVVGGGLVIVVGGLVRITCYAWASALSRLGYSPAKKISCCRKKEQQCWFSMTDVVKVKKSLREKFERKSERQAIRHWLATVALWQLSLCLGVRLREMSQSLL